MSRCRSGRGDVLESEFLPTFVGSKRQWVRHLGDFSNSDIVELFCGSAMLSASLAKTAVLNDKDPAIYKILSRFDELVVPDVFTQEDYFKNRNSSDWWRYAFCFQAMSFSGVFRYSKNGYNVPIKKNIKEVRLRERYEASLKRWKELKPTVTNLDYWHLSLSSLKDKVVILDPPYSGAQASYNDSSMNFDFYWSFVSALTHIARAVIIFDKTENLLAAKIKKIETRKMRVNGKRQGSLEGMAIYEHGAWRAPKQSTFED